MSKDPSNDKSKGKHSQNAPLRAANLRANLLRRKQKQKQKDTDQ